MSLKSVASGISLLLLFLLEIEAFDLNLSSRRSPLNVNKAKDLSEGMVRLESHTQRFKFDSGDCEGQRGSGGSRSSHDDLDKQDKMGRFLDHKGEDPQSSRNQFLLSCRNCLTIGFAASTAASWSSFPEPGSAKLYSENAANMERINNGDFSGGSVFNNNPDTERGKKRRAMTGCKVTLSREEASVNILKRTKMMSEKECNTMVMDGETEFMLQALRNLDCPTCANGIGQVQ
eukprot:CAMPEP_0116143700 /NCGR_PEP_ID=MMETSP0329-20121206/15591_1 /TAXON_ID=697910 /ORGANISM="Pseudo-nitzschia arenysensis, Strain B593" /LENGTH=231 /DNA_ID=CAMNT_0003639039 /DNA_START=95 /DNA_END=790 /DNA_ORIENTATION=-